MLLLEIVLVFFIIGLASGGSLRVAANTPLRGQQILMISLILYLSLPIVAQTLDVSPSVALWVWLLNVVVLIAVCLANRCRLGMILASAGLAMNALVVLLNRGMPVVAPLVSGRLDYLHVPARQATRAFLLADIIHLPVPSLHGQYYSIGDIVIACGVGVVLLNGMRRSSELTE